jgi:hypothetical protein
MDALHKTVEPRSFCDSNNGILEFTDVNADRVIVASTLWANLTVVFFFDIRHYNQIVSLYLINLSVCNELGVTDRRLLQSAVNACLFISFIYVLHCSRTDWITAQMRLGDLFCLSVPSLPVPSLPVYVMVAESGFFRVLYVVPCGVDFCNSISGAVSFS